MEHINPPTAAVAFLRRVNELGCHIDSHWRVGDAGELPTFFDMTVESPRQKHFASEDVHALVVRFTANDKFHGLTAAEVYADALDRMEAGLADCEPHMPNCWARDCFPEVYDRWEAEQTN